MTVDGGYSGRLPRGDARGRRGSRAAHPARLGRRLAAFGALALTGTLLIAPTAIAADGEGLLGRTTDMDVTLWSFAVMGFFAILVTVLSITQIRLEGRRERARQEIERAHRR